MKTEDHKEYTLAYDDSPEAKERVWQLLLDWFKKNELYNGESLQQRDVTWEEAPVLLTEIAETGFRFDANWKEDTDP